MNLKNDMEIGSQNSARDAIESFDKDWHHVRALADEGVREEVWRLVQGEIQALADLFYNAMFADPQASALLDHSVVNSRLHASMQRWLAQLFDPSVPPAVLADTQRRTGEVHARIGVPLVLVSRGGRVLKQAMVQRLGHVLPARKELLEAALYIQELLTLAVDAMASAFSSNSSRLARSEEAYRLFFLGQDMKAERERRRSELLEWAHQILERYYWDSGDGDDGEVDTPREEHSQFTLWLHHKAAMLFEGAAEVELIRADMQRVELELLPQLSQVRSSRSDARPIVGEINRSIGRIKELLGAMFDRYLAVEDGRDNVTALLNRRYFPAIARREIAVATAHNSQFAVLMLDVDGFPAVVDTWGHDAGNGVLAQCAGMLQESLRAGDFVFRVGDSEFLILLVECLPEAALRVAEGLRSRIQAMHFQAGAGRDIRLSVSVGIALFDGHPDYQHLLDRANAALHEAQAGGGNRCCSST